jgi:hypothetical protein
MKKTKTTKKTTNKKQQKKKIIVTTLAVGATGILGYFGWQYLKKKRQAKTNDLDSLITKVQQPVIPKTSIVPVKTKAKLPVYTPKPIPERTDGFPLTKGSKGDNVRKLQEALIAKYGSQVLPKYGVDGDFGSEVLNALKKVGLPSTVSESTFNVLTQKGQSSNIYSIAKELYKAVIGKDFNKAIAQLKNLKTVEDYSTANEAFKQNRINGVRQTIVNGVLSAFPTDSQKQKIKFEFLRMGLQFDGNKWSLSGFDGLSLVTAFPTQVWISATESVKVPARMVLGNEVSKRLDYTLFENKGKYFLVQSKTVKYL